MVGERPAKLCAYGSTVIHGMSIPRVKHWAWRILTAGQFYDGLIAILAATAGIVTSQKLIVDGWRVAGRLVAVSAFGVCALSILRAIVAYRHEAKKESLHELEGCLMIIHAILAEDAPLDCQRETGLRLTVHVAISDHQLQQVLDYVGDERGGRYTAGRVFPMQSGIAGHVYRTREPFAAERFEEGYEGYVSELIREWSYTEEDARKVSPATRAWMAVPLIVPSTSKIQGILYLDSTDRNFFTARRQRLVINAAYGVALFVTQRYSNS